MSQKNIIADIIEKNPLILFSPYTQIQVDYLIRMGEEILTDMKGIKDNKVECDLQKVYGQILLWILGAYEVLRTMDQPHNSFDETIKNEITELKRTFAEIRMPFAKQEFNKNGGYINNEISISGFGNGDIHFTIKNRTYKFKTMLNNFKSLIRKIKPSHIYKKIDN